MEKIQNELAILIWKTSFSEWEIIWNVASLVGNIFQLVTKEFNIHNMQELWHD